MKRVVLPLLSLALGLVGLGALRAANGSRHESPSARFDASASGAIGRALTRIAPAIVLPDPADDRNVAEILRRLRDGEPGTYISDIIRERDSALVRWADRRGKPLTVWVQPQSSVADFLPEFVSRVQIAFDSWDGLELPVRFAFVPDSAAAEVHVNWIDHFDEPISGRTRWARDEAWTITDANIVLAVHHHRGEVLDAESVKAMAMHEIGHLLGLDHTTDSTSIMAPRVRVRDLSDADRATVKLLYTLPAGPLK